MPSKSKLFIEFLVLLTGIEDKNNHQSSNSRMPDISDLIGLFKCKTIITKTTTERAVTSDEATWLSLQKLTFILQILSLLGKAGMYMPNL